jgi:DNA/RNA endonuclease G (NUC1)
VISPASWSLNVGQTKAFTARALDASNFRVYGATFTWTTGDATIATVEATGVATGRKVGSTTVRAATAGVSVPGTATIDVTPVAGTIIVQARTNPLPVGFQTQLFLSSGVDANGNPVGNADVTWSSSAPGVVSVNPSTGVLTANGVGQAVLTATAKSDGISKGTTTIVTNNPPTNPNARTGHNTELGTPTDADASDDIIIARRQYTTSYNPRRGVTNWVSWNLDASHKGSVLRCNCFTADTALVRLGLPAYETSDWINNGSNGQYSRGHMSPSADWQISDGDNAPTFFLTNMLPQNQAMNGGPWGDFENYLRTRAVGSTEIYIISGGIFTKDRRGAGSDGFGTISNAGKIAIPDSIWKVAVIVPDGRAASGIVSPADVEVIAINTPNEAPAAGASYSTYFTTVDSIQKSTGYNLLSILPEAVQCRLEVRNCAPAATIVGSGVAGGSEGQTLDFAGSASTDPDGDALTYRWDVDGQAAGTQPSLSYRFGNDGTYQVRLIVTDSRGASDTAAAAVRIANVAPTVNALSGAAISEGGVYALSGSFNDPGDDRWAATVSYGDGSGAQPLTLVGRTFSLSHTYANNGQYTVTVTVSETGAGAAGGSQSATVTVANVAPVVAAFDGATILRGERYDAAGTFADPGADQWSATVNYGDGSGSSTLALDGFGFSLQHTYTTAGVRTVTVSVADADGGAGTRTAQVTVLSTEGGVAALASTIAGLASTGAVQDADARWLANKLDVAAKELARGNSGPARNQLEQVVERIAAALSAGRLSSADAASLTAYANRLLASMS